MARQSNMMKVLLSVLAFFVIILLASQSGEVVGRLLFHAGINL